MKISDKTIETMFKVASKSQPCAPVVLPSNTKVKLVKVGGADFVAVYYYDSPIFVAKASDLRDLEDKITPDPFAVFMSDHGYTTKSTHDRINHLLAYFKVPARVSRTAGVGHVVPMPITGATLRTVTPLRSNGVVCCQSNDGEWSFCESHFPDAFFN